MKNELDKMGFHIVIRHVKCNMNEMDIVAFYLGPNLGKQKW